MKKIKQSIFLLLSLMVVMVSVAPKAVLAAEVATAQTEASVTFTAGQLQLITTPNINFGTHFISAAIENHQATAISSKVVVRDLRGSGSGWGLTATLSAFNHNVAGTDKPTLSGSSISVTSQTVTGSNSNASTAPQGNGFELIAAGASAPVLTAQQDRGMGQWESLLENISVSLKVLPGTALIGTSYATITWALQDTP